METYSIANFPQYARAKVEARDKGVCAMCGLDTEALGARWRRQELDLRAAAGEHVGRGRRYKDFPIHLTHVLERDEAWRVLRTEMEVYFGKWRTAYRTRWSLWDMDHIVPVKDGGGQCGLENLRTLCLPCHRQVTREWRRANSKRVRNRVRVTQPTPSAAR